MDQNTIEARVAQSNAPEGFVHVALGDGFATHVGPLFIKMIDGMPSLGFRVMDYHCNPAMICHGGMMMTVMDMALGMGTHAKSKIERFTPSVNLTYDFLKPAPLGVWLQSRVEFIDVRKSLSFGNAYLDGPDGPVMRANGIMKIPAEGNSKFTIKEESRLGKFINRSD